MYVRVCARLLLISAFRLYVVVARRDPLRVGGVAVARNPNIEKGGIEAPSPMRYVLSCAT